MRNYQEELDQIKPSDALRAETLRKVHEENRLFQVDSAHRLVGFPPANQKFNWRIPIAAAACLCALAASVWLLRAASAPVTNLSAAAKPISVSVAYRGRQDVTEDVTTVEEFSKRCGIDFANLFAGFSLDDASLELFSNAQNSVIGDYGELNYLNGSRKITLYASSTDPIAPDALLNGPSRQIGGAQVWFGKSGDGKNLYAAWVQNGTALCAQGVGMRLSSFIGCVRSALE